jgi:RNA-directed DNA polymerase
VIARYYGTFNKARRDQWVFGDRSNGAYLRKFAWTRIIRHQIVKGAASLDDPALTAYWANRRRKTPPPLIGGASLRLIGAQDGRCWLCGGSLLPADDQPQSPHEWEQWLAAVRTTTTKVAVRKDGSSNETEPRLIHAHCRERHTRNGNSPALLPANEPSGLA